MPNFVTLILDAVDGTATPVGAGAAVLVPSAQLTDTTEDLLVLQAPVMVQLPSGTSPSVRLLATDNAALNPSGWAWTINFRGVPGNPAPFSFFLPASPFSFGATTGTPCVFTASGSAYANGSPVVLSGSSLPGGFTAGTTYYVVAASGGTFELAATAGGSPLASTSSGSGTVATATVYLSSVPPVSTAVTQFPANPMTAAGDTIYGGPAPAGVPQRLAGNTSAAKRYLTSTGTGTAANAPAWAAISASDLPYAATRSVTLTVAASNSSTAGKAAADYLCTGTNDDVTINAAISALPAAGGRIVLLEGTYTCPNPVIVNGPGVTVQGQGYGFSTVIGVPAGTISRTAAVIIGNTTTATLGSGIRDITIKVDGGTGAVNPGTGHGVVIAGNAAVLENVHVKYCSGDAFHYSQDALSPALTTTIASASNGQSLPQSVISVASTAGFASSGTLIIRQAGGAAWVTYTGTSGGNSFTGCTATWRGAPGYTLATGSTVYQTASVFDHVTQTCYAQVYGGVGYFIDPLVFDAAWITARAYGASSKPGASSGLQHGFLVYGSSAKFINCHPYFNAGSGMKINDTNAGTSASVVIDGGEWENNTDAGIRIQSNVNTVTIANGAQFYGNGLSGTGQDILLGFGSANVRISGCEFNYTSSSGIARNIYAATSTYCTITGCFFSYSGAIPNIQLDGPSGAVSNFTITSNRFANQNSGSTAVRLAGNTTNCTVAGNTTDASITETGSTPNGNMITGNTVVSGFSAAITVTGANSWAWGNFAGSAPTAVPVALGGTGQATAAAAYNALSPMTTLGDVEYESGAGAAARLAGNTTAQIQYLSQTGTGSVSAAPAWSVVSGQFLCAPSSYAPGTRATPATSSTTMGAVDSTNINTGSFTAPASGNVLVMASFVFGTAGNTQFAAFALAAHGTVTPLIGNVVCVENNAQPAQAAARFLVTGLTPGSSYNLDLLFSAPSSAAVTVYAQGQATVTPSAAAAAPVIMTVQAA